MLEYIHANYGQEVTVDQIASAAAVSERECMRCFKNTIGTTPMQYLKQYRVQTAMRLLSTTDNLVGDIGCACGFADMSYFSKTFRELQGCTPSAYRVISRSK